MKMKDWKIRGIASLEMAIILPLLLLIVFGMIQFGIGWFFKQVITNGAREGARYGVVVSDPPITDSQVMTKVINYLNGSGVNAADAVVVVSYDNGAATYSTCARGCEVGVSVSVPITNLVPQLFPIFPAILSAEAVMRHE